MATAADDVIVNGVLVPAGEKLPKLTDEQEAKLKRIGLLGGKAKNDGEDGETPISSMNRAQLDEHAATIIDGYDPGDYETKGDVVAALEDAS